MINLDPNNVLNLTLAKLLKTDFTQFDSASHALEYISKSLKSALSVERVSIWGLYNDSIVLEFLYAKDQIVSPGITLRQEDYPSYFEVVKEGLPIVANDAPRHKGTKEFSKDYLKPLGISSMLDVPIHEHGKQTGVLCCEHIGESRTWKESEVYFVSLVAGLISLVNSLFEVKETKKKLREERVLLRTIIDNLPLNVFVKDKEHKWILSNKSTLKYLGLEKEEDVIGKSDIELLPNVNNKFVYEQDSSVLETGEPILSKIGFNVRPGDLSFRKFLISKFPLVNDKSEVSAVIGISEDITERNQIEELLKESEEKFRFIAENTSDGIIVAENGLLTYYSPACERITGYSFDEMLELNRGNLMDLIHPEDREGADKILKKAVAEKKASVVLKHRAKHKTDGYTWRDSTVSYFYDSSGEIWRVIVVIRDITETVNSEMQIRESERLLSEILHSLNEAVWAIDYYTYTPLFMSKSFEVLFGFSLDEWKDKPERWMDVIHEEDKHFINTVMDDVQHKSFASYTLRVLNKEGDVRWVENRGKIIFDNAGKPTMLLGMAVDITDKVTALKELEKSEKQLSIILNSLDEIVWAINLPSREPLFISDSFEKVFGIPTEQWYEDYGIWSEYVAESSIKEKNRMLKELFSKGSSKGLLQIKDANGNIKWLNTVAKYVHKENNELDMMLGISLDITEQVNTQNQLKSSERNLSDLLFALDEAVWAASIPDYVPLFVSKSFEEFYGFSLEEWQEDWFLWEQAVHPEHRHLIDDFKKRVYSFEIATGTCKIVSKNGVERWVHNIAKTIRDESGEPYMLLGVAIDVTGEIENEKELNEVKNKAMKAEMARAELELKTLQMQMNPHFIFNSLNSIQSFILKNDVISTNDYLSKFARLIRSFLDSSRSVKIRLREEIKLITLYVEMEQMRFGDKFDFQLNVGPDVDVLMEIPSMMLQPFVENSINHGIRYKDKKGLLKISFENLEGSLLCKIEDDGVGRDRAEAILAKTNKGYISQGLKITAERFMTYNAIHQSNITYKVSNLIDEPGVKDVGTSVEVSFPFVNSLKGGD
ncbi:PAS domain S-box protein [uncultured Arcticibacterium sp.]|uniref:PAS domain S-box protein n=1 Tax=uncultured Arcticibacterium sp. TaxID=2173042 RepID=UPI0030FA4C47